jgi:hypothetical protein
MDDLHFLEVLIALAEFDLFSVAARAQAVLFQAHSQTDSSWIGKRRDERQT